MIKVTGLIFTHKNSPAHFYDSDCFFLAFIPLFINPHGYKMILYLYENMGNSLMLSNISEWQCSDLNLLVDYPFFILAFIILILIGIEIFLKGIL